MTNLLGGLPLTLTEVSSNGLKHALVALENILGTLWSALNVDKERSGLSGPCSGKARAVLDEKCDGLRDGPTFQTTSDLSGWKLAVYKQMNACWS